MLKEILAVAVGIIIVSLAVVSAYNYVILHDLDLNNAKWVCLAQECTAYATGDEWVKQNCNLDSGNEMVCEFNIPSIGQNVTMPLKNINISNMVSCKVYECSSYALVSYSNKLKEVK